MQLLDNLRQDLSYSVRTYARTPGLTILVIATLGIGIGANTALYTIINSVFIQPLPYPDSDSLVHIVENVPGEESPTGAPLRRTGMTVSDFLAWRERATTLSHMAIYAYTSATLVRPNNAVHLAGQRVSPALFSMLDAKLLVGNLSELEEDNTSRLPGVVLAYRTWQKHFNADRSVIGQPVMLDGRAHTVIGVLTPMGLIRSGGQVNYIV
jgi:hypothetical protein